MGLAPRVVLLDTVNMYVSALVLLSALPLWVRAIGLVWMLMPIYTDCEWLWEHRKLEVK